MIHLTKAFFKLSFGWRRGSGSVSVFSALTQPICHVLRKHKSSPLLMLLQHMTTWEKQGEGQGFNCGGGGGGAADGTSWHWWKWINCFILKQKMDQKQNPDQREKSFFLSFFKPTSISCEFPNFIPCYRFSLMSLCFHSVSSTLPN